MDFRLDEQSGADNFENASYSYSEGFWAPATMDGIIVVYSLLYFWSLREEQ